MRLAACGVCMFAEVSCSRVINLRRSPPLPPLLLVALHPLPSLQCVGHITRLMLQSPHGLQQPALKLMAESGDEELLRLTLDQIGNMTAVSFVLPGGRGVPLRAADASRNKLLLIWVNIERTQAHIH